MSTDPARARQEPQSRVTLAGTEGAERGPRIDAILHSLDYLPFKTLPISKNEENPREGVGQGRGITFPPSRGRRSK